jgi:hypothetical protein
VRAIRRRDLLALDMRSRTYCWPVEMLLKAARARMVMVEVAATARPRSGGRSKVRGSMPASARGGQVRRGIPPVRPVPPDRAAGP